MWSVPPMWSGEVVAILASGPSMTPEVAEAVRAADIATIAVNSSFRLAPWADLLYGADAPWWAHPDNADAHRFEGMKVSCSPVRGVLQLMNTGNTGFDEDPSCVRTGGNSGHQAVHLAAHAGAARVLLLGFDMHGGHWHKPHPAGLENPSADSFDRWIGRFAVLAPILATRGVDVVNCTPGSALDCFRRSTLAAELEVETV